MLRRIVLAACVAALLLPSAADAATELGQTTFGADSCGDGGTLAWQTSPSHQAPAKGVLTQLRTSSGTAGAVVSIKVVRPSTTTILFTTAPLTVDAPGEIESVAVRVPVEAGDSLGFWLGTVDNICATTDPAGAIAGVIGSPDQGPGPVAGSITNSSGARLAVAARFEADADGDGFGDETQDGCPSDATITGGPCTADGALTATATPASIEIGDIAVLDMSVASAGTVRGAALTAALPAGLEFVLATPRSCAFTAALSRGLGDFTNGSREAALVVRGAVAGSYAIPVGLSATTSDTNLANNAVSVALTVTPAVNKACVVPRLKRRTKAFAKALLKAAGCRLGATKTKRVKKGKPRRVIAQTRKAGASVPLGTKVGITLSKRARR
jgi:hypothetical protein